MAKLQKTANIYSFKLTGKSAICKDFTWSTARLKNISKEWIESSKIPGERNYLDIDSLREASLGGTQSWIFNNSQHVKTWMMRSR